MSSAARIADVVCEQGLACHAADGVTLATDVYRPARGGPWPGLLLRVPYDRRVAQTGGYAHPSWYARHGFVVAVQDVRGRHDSGGTFEPFLHEGDDGVAAIEWLASLPSCSGRVATYGYSYCGAIQPLAAAPQPPPLVGIAPGFWSADVRDHWAYPGGPLALAFCLGWGLELAAGAARARADADGAVRLRDATAGFEHVRRAPPLGAAAAALGLHGAPWPDWALHEPTEPYWDRYAELAVEVEQPALHVGGWYDVFASGTIEGFRRSRGPARLLLGPWWHGPWTWSPRADARLVDDRQLAFFRQLLHGDSAPERPPVEAYVLNADRWLSLPSWPPPDARPLTLHLRSGGRANSCLGDGSLAPEPPAADEAPDVYVHDPWRAPAAAGGHSCCDPTLAPMGPADQRVAEHSPAVLVYTAAPLDRPLLLAGPVRLALHASSDRADTDFIATLCAVAPDGRSTNLLEGAARASLSGGASRPLEPDVPIELEIELGDVCAELASGWSLRLDLASSRAPQWRPTRNRPDTGIAWSDLSGAAIATNIVLHDADHPSRLIVTLIDDS